jgi:tetratricopeptide (TPR) repeat protein
MKGHFARSAVRLVAVLAGPLLLMACASRAVAPGSLTPALAESASPLKASAPRLLRGGARSPGDSITRTGLAGSTKTARVAGALEERSRSTERRPSARAEVAPAGVRNPRGRRSIEPARVTTTTLEESKSTRAALRRRAAEDYRAGRVALRDGRPKAALRSFNLCLEADNDFGDALYYRGLARARLGQDLLAELDFERATRMNPSGRARGDFAECYRAHTLSGLEAGHSARDVLLALRRAERYGAKGLSEEVAQGLLARALLAFGRGDEARLRADAAVLEELESAPALLALARPYVERAAERSAHGELDGAEEDLRWALELSPGFAEAELQLAELLTSRQLTRSEGSGSVTITEADRPLIEAMLNSARIERRGPEGRADADPIAPEAEAEVAGAPMTRRPDAPRDPGPGTLEAPRRSDTMGWSQRLSILTGAMVLCALALYGGFARAAA